MYEDAPEGQKVTMVHLFSIRYAKIISENHYVANDILKYTELRNGEKISKKYFSEINKGLNIAKYVIEKKSILDYIKQH
jgi:5-methylcytosine-specific restriction protein B